MTHDTSRESYEFSKLGFIMLFTYHYIPPSCFTIFYHKTVFPLTKFLLHNSLEIIVSDNLIGLSEVKNQ